MVSGAGPVFYIFSGNAIYCDLLPLQNCINIYYISKVIQSKCKNLGHIYCNVSNVRESSTSRVALPQRRTFNCTDFKVIVEGT